MDYIKSMSIEIDGGNVIIPYSAVAKIDRISINSEEASDTDNWFLGVINLYEKKIPLISLDRLVESHNDAIIFDEKQKILILNKPFKDTKVDFVSLILRSSPKILKIEEQNISFFDEYHESSTIHPVKLDMNVVHILNVKRVFTLVEEFLSK